MGMLEPIANPIWVFLFLGERPTAYSLARGRDRSRSDRLANDHVRPAGGRGRSDRLAGSDRLARQAEFPPNALAVGVERGRELQPPLGALDPDRRGHEGDPARLAQRLRSRAPSRSGGPRAARGRAPPGCRRRGSGRPTSRASRRERSRESSAFELATIPDAALVGAIPARSPPTPAAREAARASRTGGRSRRRARTRRRTPRTCGRARSAGARCRGARLPSRSAAPTARR